MNSPNAILTATWFFIALLLIIQPWLSRKNVLFGVVFGSDDIWTDKAAKKIRLRYLLTMICGTVLLSIPVVLYFLLATPFESTAVYVYILGIFVFILYSTVVFAIFHKQTKALKSGKAPDKNLVTKKVTVETSLPDSKTVLSSAWLLLFLPGLLADYSVFLLNFPAMLAHMPAPTSFRTWMQLLLQIIIDTFITVILVVCCLFTRHAPASVRGNPGAAPESFRFRKAMIYLIILLGVMVQISSLTTETSYLIPVSPILIFLPLAIDLLTAAAIFLIYFRFVRAKKPKGPILDDDQKWALGMFYFNPSDPSVFIEKRYGIGYTLNFARPSAWAFFIGILAFAIVIIVISSM